jgi:hypothetical protein
MVYDEARSMTILIGGMNAERTMNGKTWGWDGTTWRELSATGPSPRIGSGIAYDAARREVVLFGGTGESFTHTGDTWLWNGRAWREANGGWPRGARDGLHGVRPWAWRYGALWRAFQVSRRRSRHVGVERQQLATRPLSARLRARIDLGVQSVARL